MKLTEEMLKALQDALNDKFKGNPSEQKAKSSNRGSKRGKSKKPVPVQP